MRAAILLMMCALVGCKQTKPPTISIDRTPPKQGECKVIDGVLMAGPGTYCSYGPIAVGKPVEPKKGN